MSEAHDEHGFNANKIFITLFILTAVEVGWSIVFKHHSHWIKWGALCVFAFWKGMLIYTYFMHMKFEGWIVKALVAPTPILIAILVCALMPDVSFNDKLVYPVGTQLDKSAPPTGRVTSMLDHPHEAGAPAKH